MCVAMRRQRRPWLSHFLEEEKLFVLARQNIGVMITCRKPYTPLGEMPNWDDEEKLYTSTPPPPPPPNAE